MSLSEQLQSLRAEQGRLTTAIKDAGERIGLRLSSLETKLAMAGEPDPDIQADIDALRDSVNAISRLGGDAEQVASNVGAVSTEQAAAEDAKAAESGEAETHEAGGESQVGDATVESDVAVTTTPVDEAAEEAELDSDDKEFEDADAVDNF